MAKYTEEFKREMVKKLLPPNSILASALSREIGVGKSTLYKWRKKYVEGWAVTSSTTTTSENWSGANKLDIVIETAAMNAAELSAYCREKGLYPEQVAGWKHAAIMGNARQDQLDAESKKAINAERKKVHDLERDLRRKEKALAETAALLVLRKKATAIWGESEEC